MTVEPPRILVIDDDPDLRSMLCRMLRAEGFPVRTAADGPSALQLIENEKFDVLITDIGLPPPMDGFEIVRRARASTPGVRSLFISGTERAKWDDPEREDFIYKPFRTSELVGCIWELYWRQTRSPQGCAV
jgi:DNA-binding response OmpR family regulator